VSVSVTATAAFAGGSSTVTIVPFALVAETDTDAVVLVTTVAEAEALLVDCALGTATVDEPAQAESTTATMATPIAPLEKTGNCRTRPPSEYRGAMIAPRYRRIRQKHRRS
jgi:hypothetical protein